ncbi:MAG: hypothetical protein IH606_03360 [Burkholderiales bacterium]|nr:hypothetical protein [Burkholderiales bacterium]
MKKLLAVLVASMFFAGSSFGQQAGAGGATGAAAGGVTAGMVAAAVAVVAVAVAASQNDDNPALPATPTVTTQ